MSHNDTCKPSKDSFARNSACALDSNTVTSYPATSGPLLPPIWPTTMCSWERHARRPRPYGDLDELPRSGTGRAALPVEPRSVPAGHPGASPGTLSGSWPAFWSFWSRKNSGDPIVATTVAAVVETRAMKIADWGHEDRGHSPDWRHEDRSRHPDRAHDRGSGSCVRDSGYNSGRLVQRDIKRQNQLLNPALPHRDILLRPNTLSEGTVIGVDRTLLHHTTSSVQHRAPQ